MGKWLRRLAYLLRQSSHDRELCEEIEAHHGSAEPAAGARGRFIRERTLVRRGDSRRAYWIFAFE